MKNLLFTISVTLGLIIFLPQTTRAQDSLCSVRIDTFEHVNTVVINTYGMKVITLPSQYDEVVILGNFTYALNETDGHIEVTSNTTRIVDGSLVNLDTEQKYEFMCLKDSLEPTEDTSYITLAVLVPRDAQVQIVR